MPFSLKMSQGIFQMRKDHITDKLPGIIAIHDDICIFGYVPQEHNKNLMRLMNAVECNSLV